MATIQNIKSKHYIKQFYLYKSEVQSKFQTLQKSDYLDYIKSYFEDFVNHEVISNLEKVITFWGKDIHHYLHINSTLGDLIKQDLENKHIPIKDIHEAIFYTLVIKSQENKDFDITCLVYLDMNEYLREDSIDQDYCDLLSLEANN